MEMSGIEYNQIYFMRSAYIYFIGSLPLDKEHEATTNKTLKSNVVCEFHPLFLIINLD